MKKIVNGFSFHTFGRNNQSKYGYGNEISKRSFGTEANKRLLELLLQELIPERTISELELSPQEYVNPDEDSKDIRVDIATRLPTHAKRALRRELNRESPRGKREDERKRDSKWRRIS